MILETSIISNNHVQVVYVFKQQTIIVNTSNNPLFETQKMFSGFEGLEEMFNEYKKSFSEEVDYKTTVDFFTPKIKPFTIDA